ncbi:hypothetical protein EFS08_02190 [Leuconostoc suionicum]|nr:hypothetical protein [Leuconostoc suionicum]
MKQKTWIILNTVISLSLIIALLTATIITGNNIYTKIGTSFFGILIGFAHKSIIRTIFYLGLN